MTEDNQNQPTRYGKPLYQTNPSIPQQNEIAKTRRVEIGDGRRGLVIDRGTGEIIGQGGAYAYQLEEVDKERFVKLYLGAIEAAVGMSKAGLSVFQIVYDQIRESKEQDFVWLDAGSAGLPQRTYQRGVKELLDRGFIYRSPNPGRFWVNIKFMFNGNRLAFVKAYQLKGTGQQLDLLDAVVQTSEQQVEGASQ